MSSHAGTQQRSVADALARRVEARRGAESVWVAALGDLGAVDQAVYEAVPYPPELDGPVRRRCRLGRLRALVHPNPVVVGVDAGGGADRP
jgi:hypothetical protein